MGLEDDWWHRVMDTPAYDTMVQGVVPFYEELLATLLAQVPSEASGVLELGSGTGIVTQEIRTFLPAAGITCIDISPRMLAIAAGKSQLAGVILVEGDIRSPWPAGPYDVIVSSLVLHHLDPADRSAVALRAARSLAPGGRFICGDIFRPQSRETEERLVEEWCAHMQSYGIPREVIMGMMRRREERYPLFDTVHSFSDRLMDAGFTRVSAIFEKGFGGVVVGEKSLGT